MPTFQSPAVVSCRVQGERQVPSIRCSKMPDRRDASAKLAWAGWGQARKVAMMPWFTVGLVVGDSWLAGRRPKRHLGRLKVGPTLMIGQVGTGWIQTQSTGSLNRLVAVRKSEFSVELDPQLEGPTTPTIGNSWLITHSAVRWLRSPGPLQPPPLKWAT